MTGWDEPRLRARLTEEAFRHVDLEHGPLFRVTLFSSDHGQQIALIVIHHIVADFWSLAVLARELPVLYRQEVTGVPASLPPPGLPYEEHVQREVEGLAGERGEAGWSFWRETLEGLPNLELMTDRPRPAIQTYRGDLRTRLLPVGLAAQLKSLSRRRGATFFMTLVAAFQTLLLRHTGQEDLAIGSPTAGRQGSAFAGTVGYFVNPVVLRGDLSGDPPFSELLARTRRRVLAAFEHQDYPLPLLAERLRPQRDASRTPLFQVSLVLQKEQRGVRGLAAFVLGQEGVPIELGEIRAASVRLDRPPTPFDLQLHVAETVGGLGLGLQLNTDLFDVTTGEQLLERFEVLLRGIAEDPDATLSALPVLPEAERHQLLLGWNDTDAEVSESTLWELFAAQAARTPEAVAVVFEGERLTYEELFRCAAALARQLTALGVGPEVVVGVCEERSLELVVGLLAVLAAGGAYLPLEPSLPRERLATLLDDARPAVLLTRRSRRSELPAVPPTVQIAWLDGAARPPSAAEPVPSQAQADNAAYLIYTSGSTGRPKGVVNRHRGIVNRLLWMQEAFSLGADDRVLQKTPFGFDVSVWEFFAPLVTGGRLVVSRLGGHQDPAYLADLVAREGVTTIHFVPSLLPVFLAEPGVAAACSTVRRVIVSGEALPFDVEQRCLATLPAPLFNLYGPTEAAVEVTAWRCRPAPAPQPVPIGRPIRNTRIYLLDPFFEPVPPGAPGELAIGGVQVARGYLGRPDLTAERFVPDPFGGRLYRTGDLARHLADGRLEFLGRIDHQVKIRGFRIEPQEIEQQLGTYPGVAEAVVVVRQEGLLLACVVPEAGAFLDPISLREHLAARLPSYMVPAGFAFLDQLPRLSNGKVDRKALALLAPSPMAEGGGRAPRTPLEEILAGLFAEVLAVDQVGVEDGFFDLGGHSLAAMRLVARVREALGIELPVRTVFEASTVEALAAELERRTAPGAIRPPLVPVPREAPLPLSFAQQRLWFLDQLEPGSPAYHMPAAVRLTGPFDRPALAAAFSEVVRRHEVLRTTFRIVDGEPVQVIAPDAAVPLPLVDLRGLSLADRSREADRLSAAEARRPFDLNDPRGGPLLRTTLVAVEPEEHILLVNLHHIVSDGWSLGVLVRELGAFFTSPLPELAIQYADFAVWQRQALSGAWLDAELSWWRGQLAGGPEALDLPTDRPRPAVLSFRGAVREVVLDVRDLADLARRYDATLFMALLAGFAVLLSRYSGQDDLLLGTPVAGRTQVETEPLIGLFVNTLALRTDLSGGPTFREALRRVRETTLAAYAHQELPFERLVEEMAPERDLSRPPLVQAVLVLQNAPVAPLVLPGLTLAAEQLPTGTAKFELTLTLTETDGRVQGGLEYNRDLFDEATAARLTDRLERLLAGAVATPERRIAELPLLSAAEQEQLLGWNAGTTETEETTLVALFEAAVARQPSAPAVRFEGRTLSYGELNARAEALAHRLVRSGVGPEVRVGVCLTRTPLLIASLLAVLKAGGAYVPLDPEYPRERLAFLLEDSGAAVLLTERDLAERCGPFAGVVVDPTDPTDPTDRSDPLPPVLPDNLAYVIYTSGSTGKPKGVPIRHGSVARLLRATEAWFGFGSADVWTLFHSYAFDFSVWELWGALAYGGRLVVVPYWVSRSPEAFLRLLADEGVTVLNQTPSAFRELVQAEGAARPVPLALRLVIFGGEAVDLASLAPWIERHGDRSPLLVNMYGITETTVHVTYRPLTSADAGNPIGEAIPDLSLRLLGTEGELVPVGVAGEICVGGPGLARGYLGRPELTAERFVPDPYSAKPGGRLYRAGDLARYRPDGEIDYLGRIDHQVKIRGFRIELGEIEAALLAHPEVRTAVVLLRQDLPGGPGLFACVAADEGAVSAGTLRSFLQDRLPDYMLPAAYAFLPGLPLTENGKVDRRALSRLRPEREAAGGGAPRTPEEEIVAGVFAQVLGIDPPGREEDFFTLGGHSLLATQVVARIHSLFGIDLPVRAVFEAPTVAGLAARIGQVARPEAIPRVSRQEPLVLSFAQQRLWFLDQMEPGSPAYNIPLQARLVGNLDRAALAAAFSALVRRHETLRTTFANEKGEPGQVISPGGAAALPEVDLRSLPSREREAGRIAWEEARRPFDLSGLRGGPLLRALLLTLGSEESVLLLNLHHIVSDGWSMGVLVRELGSFYEGSPLPELPIQYADYAAWQRRRLSGAVLDGEIAWWRERLQGLPVALDLPTDHARPAARSLRGALHSFTIDGETSAGLAALARQHGATLFMTLLAGFAALLSRLAGEDDLAVGTPVAGRTRVETEPLIGLFVNTLALRVDLSGDPEIAELLNRVRETTLAAYAHQELPFERLVEALVPERDLSRPLLLQVMLVLQNAPVAPLELPGLTLSVAPLDTGTSKLELTLLLTETGQGLTGSLEYSLDLFEEATAARLAGRFARLLAAAVADPRQRVSDLPLLSAAERRQLLIENNEVGTAPVPEVGLHQLFEVQVARTPDATALIAGVSGERWTYAELDAWANALARRLVHAGVGPEVRVGVCLPRTPLLVASLLAVLKAGGAYVPLDPDYPQERLAFLLEDSGAAVLLNEAGLARTDRTDLTDRSESHLTLSGSLAYLIYTSGSTGRPKGVAIEHRSAVAFACWARTAFSDEELAGVLASTSVSFDLSVFELFVPLAWGGTVVLAANALEMPRLAAEVRLVNTVPSAIAELVREGGVPASVRTINLAGESLSRALVDAIYAALPGVRVLDLYGPSEATTYSTWAPALPEERHEPTIGRAIAGTRVVLLGHQGELVPAGVAGELLLGGAGLARGYLDRPDLTAERFVPDPFPPEEGGAPGGRLYRTGDLARWRPDGQLEYLGRIDHQVKVRGFRIELGEIEATLRLHPGVSAAAVVARPDKTSLLAAVVTGGTLSAAELRSFLRARLPEHMVPSAWAFLPELPLTANGKVDRKALARLQPEREAAAPVRPRTPVEERIASLFAEVLGIERVESDDDFLALGGDSLQATRLAARVRAAFGVDLPVRAIFKRPTVAGLAGMVERAARSREGAGAEPIPRIARSGPLSFENAAYNIQAAVRLRGRLDRQALAAALAAVERRHEILQTNWRSALLALGPEEHLLHLTLHDGWSLRVLLRDLGALYSGTPLPELPIQYADYAAWQRDRLSGPFLETELAWWRDTLAGVPPALAEVPGSRGAVHEFAIDLETTRGLADLARRHGATLFMALLAGFATLLSRFTGQDDLVIGTLVAGRTRVETEPLIGPFAKVLPLRVDLAGAPAFAGLLDRVRETTLAALAHQDVSIDRLVLIQAMLVFQNAAANPPALPGLEVEVVPLPAGTAKHEMTWTLSETAGGLAGTVEYNRDLFEEATIARLARQFQEILRQLE